MHSTGSRACNQPIANHSGCQRILFFFFLFSFLFFPFLSFFFPFFLFFRVCFCFCSQLLHYISEGGGSVVLESVLDREARRVQGAAPIGARYDGASSCSHFLCGGDRRKVGEIFAPHLFVSFFLRPLKRDDDGDDGEGALGRGLATVMNMHPVAAFTLQARSGANAGGQRDGPVPCPRQWKGKITIARSSSSICVRSTV